MRVPNAERSAATRAKILNATIDCLCDVGYPNTSTVLVTERAGVSRGAMLHHFPSKAELILSTFAYIAQLRRDLHTEALSPLATERERFLSLIDTLWSTFQSRPGIARLEIMVGARCDPEVAPAFGEQHQVTMDLHRKRVHDLARSLGITNAAKLDAFVMVYVGAMRGMVIESFYPSEKPLADIRAGIAMLKEFQLSLLDRLLAEG